jgi:hypothetical protein
VFGDGKGRELLRVGEERISAVKIEEAKLTGHYLLHNFSFIHPV